MKYGENEQYVRHVDYYNREERFFGHDLDKFGGQRIKTALLYLTTAEQGGETVFHKAAKNNSVGLNSCAGKCDPAYPPSQVPSAVSSEQLLHAALHMTAPEMCHTENVLTIISLHSAYE